MRVSDRRVTTATLALVLVGLLVGGAVVVVLLVAGRVRSAVGSFTHPGSTTITQSVVVERMREVARLVTSETTLRDVVLYRNSRLGSTKRSLVVVTGRILTGFDLDRGTEVRVDQAGRRIHLTLPRAAVLGVEVSELKTYDEERGLWNPFRPADRDSIFQLARRQLVATAGELALTRHAEESARRLIPALVSVEGYTTDVSFGPGASSDRDRP